MGILQLLFVGTAAPWFGLIMAKPRILTVLVITLSLIQLDWFTRYSGGIAGLNRIGLAVTGLLGLRLAMDHMIQEDLTERGKVLLSSVTRFSLYFLILAIVSNLLNDESLVLGLYDLRYYFFGFTTCFGLYRYFSESLSMDVFKKWLVWIGLAQIPFSLLKWFAAAGGEVRTLDSVSGTFGGYGELVACQIFVVSIVLFEQLTTKKRLAWIDNYLLCLLLLIPLLLSKSETASLYVFVVLFFTWFLSMVYNRNIMIFLRQAVPICLTGAVALFLLYQFFWKPNYNIEKELKLDYLVEYYMYYPVLDSTLSINGKVDPRMGRARAVVEAARLLAESPWKCIYGLGSGATAEASFLGVNGKYYQWFGPLTGLGRNHYSKTLAELGFLGATGFVFFFLSVRRRLIDTAGRRSELNAIFSLFLFSLALLSIYGQTLSSFFFSFVLAFFLATAQAEIDRRIQCPNNLSPVGRSIS